MSKKVLKSIAIIGGGPAGSTLGALLAQKGYRIGIFQIPKRPALIVGESLLPSVIPILRKIGAEEEVKSFSEYKPGATIGLATDEELSFGFCLGSKRLSYAYNTPRDLFDKALQNAATRAGAKTFKVRAQVQLNNGKPTLSPATLEATNGYFQDGIDFIVDASGRTRLLSNLMNIPSKSGHRKDVAVFAHHEDVRIKDAGHIHVDRLEQGWAWRIPLPGRVSLGVVVHPDYLKQYGNTLEEQYDNFLLSQKMTREYTSQARRISPVVKYSNYQLISQQLYGDGWALVGHGAGFLDPVFSTGVHLAMGSAQKLAKTIEKGTSRAFQKYQTTHLRELETWQQIVDYWYSGQLFTLYRIGRKFRTTPLGKLMDPHMTKHITKIFTGEAGKGSYSSRLLAFMTTYGIYGHDTAELRVN